jgi:hypothetical protein
MAVCYSQFAIRKEAVDDFATQQLRKQRTAKTTKKRIKMKTPRVITNYDKFPDSELSVIAGRVKQFMGSSTDFTNPTPPLTDHETATDDFNQKLEIANRGGSKREFAEKRESRKNLLRIMHRLASYVNYTANGSEAMLANSGFVMVSQDRNVPQPGIPARLRLKDHENSGQMRMDFDAEPDAWEYEYCIAHQTDPAEPLVWGEPVITRSSVRNIIEHLIPGDVYHVRVRARNHKGRSDWSDSVSFRVR